MIKNLCFYIIGVLFLGWIIAGFTMLFLQFMPIVGLGVLFLMPIYGVLRGKFNWTFGCKSIALRVGKVFKFGRKSWTFYLILGVALGFIYETIVWKMVEAVSIMLIGFMVFFILWEGIRKIVDKVSTVEMPSLKESMKRSW